jgi:uncharacterized protein YutE (UPF0331/DUF86 family)
VIVSKAMDAGTVVVELVKASAWPVASVILAVMFRRPLIGLVQGIKLKRLKRGDWEADFQEALGEAKREVAALSVAADAGVTPKLVEVDGALTGPAAVGAMIAAWNGVEAAVAAAAREAGVAPTSFPEQLRMLAEKGAVAAPTVDAINGLRHLRNLAVHAPEPIEPEKVREFLQMSNAVLFALSLNVKKFTGSESRRKLSG